MPLRRMSSARQAPPWRATIDAVADIRKCAQCGACVHAAPRARPVLLPPLPGRLEPPARRAPAAPRPARWTGPITAMRETPAGCPRPSGWDVPHGVRRDQRGGVVGHDGRRHPGALPPRRLRAASWQARTARPRRTTEATFAGLRFVRNRMGYPTDPADFIRRSTAAPALAASRPGPGGHYPNPRSDRSRRARGSGR